MCTSVVGRYRNTSSYTLNSEITLMLIIISSSQAHHFLVGQIALLLDHIEGTYYNLTLRRHPDEEVFPFVSASSLFPSIVLETFFTPLSPLACLLGMMMMVSFSCSLFAADLMSTPDSFLPDATLPVYPGLTVKPSVSRFVPCSRIRLEQ